MTVKAPEVMVLDLSLTEWRGICLVINGKQVISEEISLREDPE